MEQAVHSVPMPTLTKTGPRSQILQKDAEFRIELLSVTTVSVRSYDAESNDKQC